MSVPRPPEHRPRADRSRLLAAGAFAGLLAVASAFVVTRGGNAAPPARPERPATEPATSTATRPPARAATTHVIPSGVMETTRPGDLAAAYRRATGGPDEHAASGAPACERGEPDERAWSRPDAPGVVAGRYTCRFTDGGAAEMWWTDEGRGELAHATRRDGDLAALFAWWRAASA
jgi:hypothetical protein